MVKLTPSQYMTEHPAKILVADAVGEIPKSQVYYIGAPPDPIEEDVFAEYDPAYIKRAEYLADVPSDKSRDMKPCSHYVIGVDVVNHGFSYIVHGPPPESPGHYWTVRWVTNRVTAGWPTTKFGEITYPLGTALRPDLQIGALFYEKDGFRFVSDPPGVDTLQEDSLRAMLPGIKPEVSVLNALYELKDFKHIGATARSVKTSVQALQAAFRSRGWTTGRKTLRRILRGAVDLRLFQAFAVSPLLSDIDGLIRTMTVVKQKIDKLLRDEGHLKRAHFVRPLDNEYAKRSDELNDVIHPLQDGSNRFIRVVTYDEPLFRATLAYSYSFRELERQSALLRGYLDALGVKFNPQIVWNAIPWSFVVDWVFGVNRWLDNFSKANLEPVTVITDYCWSFKCARRIECWVATGVNGVHVKGSAKLKTVVAERVYKRVVPTISLYDSLRVSGLNPREFGLGAALAYSSRAYRTG